jgi:hypothetical protein
MENELLDRNERCPWKKNAVCKIPDDKPCPDDCDLKEVAWEQETIVAKIKSEEARVKELKREGMFKNRDAIGDKIMGIYVMERALKVHFNYIPAHVVDPEFEKGAGVFTKVFGRFRKK